MLVHAQMPILCVPFLPRVPQPIRLQDIKLIPLSEQLNQQHGAPLQSDIFADDETVAVTLSRQGDHFQHAGTIRSGNAVGLASTPPAVVNMSTRVYHIERDSCRCLECGGPAIGSPTIQSAPPHSCLLAIDQICLNLGKRGHPQLFPHDASIKLRCFLMSCYKYTVG